MDAAARDCCNHANELLTRAGYGVKRVYKVWAAGDSGVGCEVALYVNLNNEPYEAHFDSGGKVIGVLPSW